jgi:hypothetical protein
VTRFPDRRCRLRLALALCLIGVFSVPALRADDLESWKRRFLTGRSPNGCKERE